MSHFLCSKHALLAAIFGLMLPSTIIDCTQVGDTLSRQDAALQLTMADFREVAVAGMSSRYISPRRGRQ